MTAGKHTDGPFIRVPREIVGWLPIIGHEGMSVYVYVLHRANVKQGTPCFERIAGMAAALKMRERTVRVTLNQLTECGLLKMEEARQWSPNKYWPVIPVPTPGVSQTTSLSVSRGGPKRPPDGPRGVPNVSQGCDLGRTNKSINKNPSERALNARDIVIALYATLERMNGEAPSRNFGRDGKQAKSRLATHSPEQILAKVDAFRDYWRTSWIAQKRTGGLATAPDFWTLFDEISVRPKAAAELYAGTPLSELAEKKREKV